MSYGRFNLDEPETRDTINPIWRGIGCILFFITPITALAVSSVIIGSGFIQQYIYIPPRMLTAETIPYINYTVPYFFASIALAALITFVLFAAYFTLYAALYKVASPSRYGPKDAPPQRKRPGKRKSR